MNQESKNRALVLSGGSVRGVAYIGALQACDYLGYDFDMVGGVSAGSILSSLIAAGYDWKELTDIALDLQKSKDTDLIDYNWSQLLLTPWQYLFSKKEKGFTGLVK
ncbi:MAG: patatin-like phospholipase family protein [Patescibacteria group bacterium]|nr:patatin-like phospholipase family protein [Patescibacteria group bacterium]